MLSSLLARRHLVFGAVAVALATAPLALLAGWQLADQLGAPERGNLAGQTGSPFTSGSTWQYGGQPDSRYVITIYADLECPHCQSYFPALKAWVERQPQTALQWHHLPLPFHEPAATNLAVTAECMGNLAGQDAFWRTIEWIFLNTQGGGRGLPDDLSVPGATAAVRECLISGASKEVVQSQARRAAQEGIDATPTLKLEDRTTGNEIVLSGAVEDDRLLSALDLLSVEKGGGDEAWNVLPARSSASAGSHDLRSYDTTLPR
jgi:protein-disulfide isomerase